MSTSTPTDFVDEPRDRPRYDDYKDSGSDWLGEIPARWEMTTVKWLGEISYGLSQPPAEQDDGIPFVRATNISEGSIDGDGIVRVDPEDVPDEEDVILRRGDILVVRSGAYTGDSALVEEEFEGGVAGYDMIVRSTDEVESGYLSYYSLSDSFEMQVRISSGRTAQAHLNAEELSRFEVPLPEIKEQRAIAAYLDRETERIDALIEKKEQLIDLLEEKRTALISRVVTQGLDRDGEMQDSGVEWLGEIPVGWKTIPLKYAARRVQTGSTPSTSNREYYQDGDIPWYGPGSFKRGMELTKPVRHIHRKAVEDGEAPIFEAGSTMVVCIGATLGKVGYISESSSSNQQITTITFDEQQVMNEHGAYQLKRLEETLRAIAPNTTLPILSQEDLGSLEIALPPLAEQEEIVGFINRKTARIDGLIQKVEEGINRLEEYRTALISAAVTGQIDVREESIAPDVKEAGTWERMILTVELIRRMRAAQHQSLGRTLLAKMLYLIQHHVRVTEMSFSYKRKDYGPYASELRYEVENLLQKGGWIQVSEDSEQVQYQLLDKADDETVRAYFESSWGDLGDQIDEIVSYFHQFDAERAEIVATLYAAWNDLKILGRPHDEDAIIREVQENWHPRKQEIDESRWRKALHWMKDEGLVPTGFGEPTIEGEG